MTGMVYIRIEWKTSEAQHSEFNSVNANINQNIQIGYNNKVLHKMTITFEFVMLTYCRHSCQRGASLSKKRTSGQ